MACMQLLYANVEMKLTELLKIRAIRRANDCSDLKRGREGEQRHEQRHEKEKTIYGNS